MPIVKMRESEVRGKPGWSLSLKLCKEGLAKKRRPPGATGREKKIKETKRLQGQNPDGVGRGGIGLPRPLMTPENSFN